MIEILPALLGCADEANGACTYYSRYQAARALQGEIFASGKMASYHWGPTFFLSAQNYRYRRVDEVGVKYAWNQLNKEQSQLCLKKLLYGKPELQYLRRLLRCIALQNKPYPGQA